MRVKGLEPPSGCPRQDLNLLRLPVPPHPHINRSVYIISEGGTLSTLSFITEFDELTHPNPLNNRESVWDRTVCFEVSIFDGCIRLSNIRSLDPGHGFGTLGLIWLTTLADKHDVAISGTIIPTGDKNQKGRLSKTALKKWYARHGFSVSTRGDIKYIPAGRVTV